MHPKIQRFAELLPEPCLLVRSTGQILLGNAAAAELLGLPRATLAGRSLFEVFSQPGHKTEEFVRLCARSRQLIPGALGFVSADNKTVAVRCDGAVVDPRDETSEGTLFIRFRPKAETTDHFVLLNQKIAALSREVLERRKAEQQRDELLANERAARIEAERTGRMKDEFLATLSHELRTPLNAIMGWANILEGEPLSDTATEGVKVIARNVRAQKQLIEDLLDMSRIISGKVRLDVQRVDLATVINAALASARPTAETKRVRVQATLDPGAGPVKGDPNRLEQVVWNLLSNAIKFTPAGGRVQVSLKRVNSHLEICVADTGTGIKPEFLPHVFDRFRQQDSSTTRTVGGLGLGLSIAKQLMELHGGAIRAKSPGEGQGATFILDLPLMLLHDESTEDSLRVHSATVSDDQRGCDQDLSGVVVLVVDDENDARDVAAELLVRCNAIVHKAGDAAEALKLLAEKQPHVLVSDIGMPGGDGYELIGQIRAGAVRPATNIPAIALIAFARSEDRMRAMIAGYNLHLAKPIEPNELIVSVASLAGRISDQSSSGA